MTIVNIQKEDLLVVVTENNNAVTVTPSNINLLLTAPGAQGPPRSEDSGAIYLKANEVPTPIDTINGRAVVSGTAQTSMLVNFEKDAATNSLKYLGTNGRFHIIATFSFYAGSQDTCGFYIGINHDPSSQLDPNADRISESEIYANAGSSSVQPQSAAIQTLAQLTTGDRVFFIVQNKSKAGSILVEFLKLVVRS